MNQDLMHGRLENFISSALNLYLMVEEMILKKIIFIITLLITYLLITKHISEICRQKSLGRNQTKVIELNNIKAKRREKAVNNIIDVTKKFIKDKEEIKKIKNIIYEEISKL